MSSSVIIKCEKHGEAKAVKFQGKEVCQGCYDLYIKEIEDLGKDALLNIHEAVGLSLRKKLKDPVAFERLRILTDKGLDIIEMYNQVVNEVCRNSKLS